MTRRIIKDPFDVAAVISQPNTTCVDVILKNNRVICSNRPDWPEHKDFPNLRTDLVECPVCNGPAVMDREQENTIHCWSDDCFFMGIIED